MDGGLNVKHYEHHVNSLIVFRPRRSHAVGLGPGRYCELPGYQYVADDLLPNLYFHITAAYAILRLLGAPVGKTTDYLSFLAPLVKQEA